MAMKEPDSNTAALEAHEHKQAALSDEPEQTFDDLSLAIRKLYAERYRLNEHEPFIEGANNADWVLFGILAYQFFSLYQSEQEGARGYDLSAEMGQLVFGVMRKYMLPMVNK